MAKNWKPCKPWKEYPLRVCSYMNQCEICKKPIVLGEEYYDSGFKRAHKLCVDTKEEE